MKKLTLSILMSLAVGLAAAEDIIQVIPFQTEAGMTTDDGCSFTITMNNASADIIAYQFDLLLPEGIQLDYEDAMVDAFELADGRYPTHGRKKEKYHSIDVNVVSSGWTRVMVYDTDYHSISDHEGDILNVYFTTSEDIKEGVYPIYIKGAIMTISGSSDIKPASSTSYFSIGDSYLSTASCIDLTSLTGYIPSFVVESLNESLADNDNLSEVDMKGATELGAELQMPQGNALVFVGSEEAAQQVSGNAVIDDGSTLTCPELTLYDDGGAFSAQRDFNVTTASFDREFKAEYWSTVCLPFNVPAEKVSELKAAGCEIQQLTAFDAQKGELTFSDMTEMAANTPYLVKCPSDMKPFESLTETTVAASSTMGDIETDGATMQGIFKPTTISSNEDVTYYAYDAADGLFVRIGKNATAKPFRAVIAIPTAVDSGRQLTVVHGNEMATGVSRSKLDEQNNHLFYDLSGRIHHTLSPAMEKGIYIVNGKKITCK